MPAKLGVDSNGNLILPPGAQWLDQPAQGDTPPSAGTSPSQERLKRGQPLVMSEAESLSDPGSPITDFLGKATGAAAQGLQMTGLMGGGPLEQPRPLATTIAKGFVPQTPVELGMFVASLPIGGEMGPLMRLGKAILGGAIGGMSGETGATMTSGAFEGLAGGLTGEGIGKLSKMVTYMPWVKRIAQTDTQNVGQAVYDLVPDLGKLKTPTDFQMAFSRVYGKRRLSKMYDTGLQEISESLGDKNRVTSPTYGQVLWGESAAAGTNTSYKPVGEIRAKPGIQVPFEVAIDKVREMRERARRIFNTQPVIASEWTDKADQIEQEALGQIPPELSAKYTTLKEAYSKGLGMLSFFDKDKVRLLNKQGGIDMESLQNHFKKQGLGSREALFSASEVGKFEDALFRGAESPTVTDIAPDSPFHARIHKWGVSLPLFEALTQETSFVGKTPSRGNIPPSLASYMGGRAASTVISDRPISIRQSSDEEP